MPLRSDGVHEEVPGEFAGALTAIRAVELLRSQKWQEQQWRAKREGVHPDIVAFERALIGRFAKLGVPLYCHCALRTAEEQRSLYLQGNTKDSPHDGFWPHNGFAVDIVHSGLHWDMPEKAWALIGHVGKELAAARGLKLTWGGDWKFWDPAHWELTGWKAMGKGPYKSADKSKWPLWAEQQFGLGK